MAAFIGPLPEGWQAFPWLYFSYTELLARVHRSGSVDAKGHNVHATDSAHHMINNPHIIEYFRATSLHTKDENTSWCSAFVNWCMAAAGLHGTRSAMARSWLKWPNSDGHVYRHPIVGAIAVFPRPPSKTSGHVAFIWSIRHNGSIDVLGGNQGALHADPKHHRPSVASHVSISHRHTDEALGFIWPRGIPQPELDTVAPLLREASAAVPADLRPRDWHI